MIDVGPVRAVEETQDDPRLLQRGAGIVGYMDRRIDPSRSDVSVERFNRWAATYDRSVMQRLYFGPVHSRMLELLLVHGPKHMDCEVIDPTISIDGLVIVKDGIIQEEIIA